MTPYALSAQGEINFNTQNPHTALQMALSAGFEVALFLLSQGCPKLCLNSLTSKHFPVDYKRNAYL